jgi:muramoyltetrapeptide carboxypeptidase LdcA involved in peptidoglycan recycling
MHPIPYFSQKIFQKTEKQYIKINDFFFVGYSEVDLSLWKLYNATGCEHGVC